MNGKKNLSKKPLFQSGILRVIFKWVLILAVLVLVVYGISWAASNPSSPFSIIFIVVVIFAFSWFQTLRKSQKEGNTPYSRKPTNNPTIEIYDNYKVHFSETLTSWGFVVSESEGPIGGNTTYKRNGLQVILGYDMRDPGVYLTAFSGEKEPLKNRLDELAKLTGNKSANYDEVENHLIDKVDISIALNGSDEEKTRIVQELENWYRKNS
jgi:hypothetical protein